LDSGLLLFYGVAVEWGVWDWIWGRAVVGMWVAGFAWAFQVVKPPLWQVLQLPAAGGPLMAACMAEMLVEAGAKATPGAWQASQKAVVGM
jgi:hypothetical protein